MIPTNTRLARLRTLIAKTNASGPGLTNANKRQSPPRIRVSIPRRRLERAPPLKLSPQVLRSMFKQSPPRNRVSVAKRRLNTLKHAKVRV